MPYRQPICYTKVYLTDLMREMYQIVINMRMTLRQSSKIEWFSLPIRSAIEIKFLNRK